MSDGIEAKDGYTVFHFKGEEDRNFNVQWSGSLPRSGDVIELQGRTQRWVVVEVKWLVNVERKQGKMARAVLVTLMKEEEVLAASSIERTSDE